MRFRATLAAPTAGVLRMLQLSLYDVAAGFLGAGGGIRNRPARVLQTGPQSRQNQGDYGEVGVLQTSHATAC